MSYPTAPQSPTGPPPHSFYLPPITTSLPQSSQRDSVSSYSSSHSRFKENLDNIAITPRVPPGIHEKSHFSPSTPSMERGLAHTRFQRPGSLRERVGRALSWNSPSPEHEDCPCAHQRRGPLGWLLLVLLALVLVFLLANVIVLDVRMGANVRSVAASNPSAPTLASERSTPSSSVSSSPTSPSPTASSLPPPSSLPSPSPSAPVALASPSTAMNLASLPQVAASCVSQFPPPATLDPAAYCARCAPALFAIPQSWFVAQTRDPQNGQANLQSVGNAEQFCVNAQSRS